jgi:hypothetical protein
MWREFDDAYRQSAEQIQALNPGQASLFDLAQFLTKYCGAVNGPNTNRINFEYQEREIVAVDEEMGTVALEDNLYACGDWNGLTPQPIDGKPITQLGLNEPVVSGAIRTAFFPDRPVGAAYLNRPAGLSLVASEGPFGLIFLMRQTLSFHGERPAEEGLSLHVYRIADKSAPAEPLSPPIAAAILRKLSEATRIKDPIRTHLEEAIVTAERELVKALKLPTEEEIERRVRHAVWPVGAIVVV